MKRKTFDLILTGTGAALVMVLVAAGALLMWGASFTNGEVHNQLAMQQVYFPPAAAFANAKAGTEITPTMRTTIYRYAGQEVLTGPQAKAYATDFIRVHLSEMPYGGVYSKVSAAARAATPGTPQAAKLQAVEGTVFQGTTLRSMLLEAYAFSVFGELALDSAIAAFGAAALFLVLTALGMAHAHQVPATETFPRSTAGFSTPAVS